VEWDIPCYLALGPPQLRGLYKNIEIYDHLRANSPVKNIFLNSSPTHLFLEKRTITNFFNVA